LTVDEINEKGTTMTNPERNPQRPRSAPRCPTASGVRLRAPGRGVLVALVVLVAGVLGCVASSALALSPERHYEMVSPAFKDGFGVEKIEAVAPNGESVAYFSPGVFAGAPLGFTQFADQMAYIARRGGSGWSTSSLLPPASLTPTIYGTGTGEDVSSTLESTFALGQLGPNDENAAQLGTRDAFFFHSTGVPDIAAGWEVGGPVLERHQKPKGADEVFYNGGSADLCHLVLYGENPLLPEPAGASPDRLYEVARGCGGEPASLRFVGLNNAGGLVSPGCQEVLGLDTNSNGGRGVEGFRADNGFDAVSVGGREVFFTASVNNCEEPPHFQLFVRLNGERTVEVSRPPTPACVEVPCGGDAVAEARASAEFAGASRDGSRVFFLTTAPLVVGDRDEGNDLYVASIGCPSGEGEGCVPGETRSTGVTSLVQASYDPHAGEAADVRGVVKVAPNGSRVYFVARGALVEGVNAQGVAPVKGADNLYVYDSAAGKVAFIADLCSGPSTSGAVEDIHCPATLTEGKEPAGNDAENDTDLWAELGGEPEAQTAGASGQFLVFSSYGQLTAGDTDNARDVYRYDAETGLLNRVSIGEDGYGANGNCSDNSGEITCDASIMHSFSGGQVQQEYGMTSRAVSEDGSRIVFETAAPLSSQATNGLVDVYEWYEAPGASEGRVSLVSGGSATLPVTDAVIDPSGDNIFFVTAQGLVAQDTDGAPDLYDARTGAGFPVVPAAPEECSADACQGPLTNPAPLLVPGSVSQAPGENLTPIPVVPVKSGKTVTRAKKRANALKACGKDKQRAGRRGCEKRAREKYGVVKAMKAGNDGRAGR
jgi:hypothetical protein